MSNEISSYSIPVNATYDELTGVIAGQLCGPDTLSVVLSHLMQFHMNDPVGIRKLRGLFDQDTLDGIEDKQREFREKALKSSPACGLASRQQFRDHAVDIDAGVLLSGLIAHPIPMKTGSLGWNITDKMDYSFPDGAVLRLQVSGTITVIGSNGLPGDNAAWIAEREAIKAAKEAAAKAKK